MKKIRLTGYGAAAALILLAGCDESMYEGNGKGSISPLVSYDPTVVASRSAAGSRAAEFDEITVDDLTITLTSADGKFSQEYLYGEFPVDQVFAVGKYTITAHYGNAEEEGFEKPAVYGSADLTVTEGKNTPVELVAKPAKAMVGVSYDATATDYLSNLYATLHSAAGSDIRFSADESRCAYIQPGRVTLDVSFTKPNGKGGTVQVADFEAKAQYRYKMNVSLGGDGSGEISSITIKFDDDLAQDIIDVDISDEILSVPAPSVTLSGVTEGEVLNVVEGSALAATPRFVVNARGGIKTAFLTTAGASLLEQGWPAEVDLANLSEAQRQTLVSLGMKDMDSFRNGSTMARVDFTDVAKHIPVTVDGDASTVMFSLVVTDNNGKTSGEHPSGFGIKVDKLNIDLQPVEGYIYAGEPTVDILVSYNGTDPLQNLLAVQYLNNDGLFKNASIVSVAPRNRAAETYVVSVNVPADAQLPVTLKVSAGNVWTGDVIIPSVSAPSLAVNSNDVFARNLWATVSSDDYDCSQKEIELYVSTDGVNFAKAIGTQSGADYHITGGLSPATAYTLRAKVGALVSNTVTVTTEAATPLPNGNLDDGWSVEKRSSGAATGQFHSAPAPWNTLNEVSFSDKSALTSYSMLSCTISTTDARSGNAALVRTVGYGNNTLLAKPDHFTHGELYLGEYSSGAVYGIDFATRPSALSFWYKYSRYTATESGVAEVKVLDASGNVIASVSQLVDAASDYTQCLIPLSYSRGAAKAAKIQVVFKSTNEVAGSGSVAQKTNDYSYGALFYVDDVELVY